MAELANKYVKLPQLGTFKTEADKVYVAQEEGKTLTSNDYDNDSKAKLDGLANIKKVQIGDKEQIVDEDGTLTLDVQAVIDGDHLATDEEVAQKLEDYTKTTDLVNDPGIAGKYLDKDTAGTTYATKEEAGKLKVPVVENSALEGMKESAQEGDRVVVSDDDYHIHIFGSDSQWHDTGSHLSLDGYLTEVKADGTYTKQTDFQGLQTTVEGLDQKYVKASDMQVATDEDIRGIFSVE